MQGDLLLLLALIPVVTASAVTDLRQLRIPNSHVLLALGLFVLAAPFALDWPELSQRLLAGAITFAIGFVLFALRLFGGGDVKMMPVLMLFIPSQELVLFLRLFAPALLVVSLGALVLQSAPIFRGLGWESVRARRHVPVGVAMAVSVILLALVILFRA